MSFDKSALGGFVRDMGKAVFSRPERAGQEKPVKTLNKGIWGSGSSITRDHALKMFAKRGTHRKILIGQNGVKIKLDTEEAGEKINEFFGNTNRMLRREALERVRKMKKEAGLERQRKILPSEIKKIREEEKLINEMKPGLREMGPRTPGIAANIAHSFVNLGRIVTGHEATSLEDKSSLDASTINQNTPEIKK